MLRVLLLLFRAICPRLKATVAFRVDLIWFVLQVVVKVRYDKQVNVKKGISNVQEGFKNASRFRDGTRRHTSRRLNLK